MTDFETKVLEVLARLAGPEDTAEWVEGTLFVECADAMADLLTSEFATAFRCRIIASKAGTEWAFDFALRLRVARTAGYWPETIVGSES